MSLLMVVFITSIGDDKNKQRSGSSYTAATAGAIQMRRNLVCTNTKIDRQQHSFSYMFTCVYVCPCNVSLFLCARIYWKKQVARLKPWHLL